MKCLPFCMRQQMVLMRNQRLTGAMSAIYWAMMILLFPVTWLFPMLIAALIHELGHYLAVRCFGKRIHCITVGVSGALLETRDLAPWQEFVCILAGPIAGLTPLMVRRIFPAVALCGLLQSLFNLLPIYPLDGGRMLNCLLRILRIPEFVRKFLAVVVLVALVIAALYGAVALHLGLSPILIASILIHKAVIRKRPCKQAVHSI